MKRSDFYDYSPARRSHLDDIQRARRWLIFMFFAGLATISALIFLCVTK